MVQAQRQRRLGKPQHKADWLDPKISAMVLHELDFRLHDRWTSGWVKHADALCTISLACRISRSSHSSAFIFLANSVVKPPR
jgi:hypothetical protein